jgi:hypothetical protein
MPSLSGTGGLSSGVNYATSAMFDRMYWSLYSAPHVRRGAAVLAVTLQANTGSSGGSLKRAVYGLNIRK